VKRKRPPMPPLSVRVKVARRQFVDKFPDWRLSFTALSYTRQLPILLQRLFGEAAVALDHDPALILRDYDATVSDVADRYTPHAHDPNHLIYREKSDHQQKTTGRKPGAERTITIKGSDIGLKTKFARLERPAKKKKKIPSRPFPKSQKRSWR
jgi:hypothetical protein